MSIPANALGRVLGWELAKAGKKLVAAGAVQDLTQDSSSASGVVVSASHRQPCKVLWVGRNLIEGKCSCSRARRCAGLCEHVAALVVACSDWSPPAQATPPPAPSSSAQPSPSAPTTSPRPSPAKKLPSTLTFRPLEVILPPIDRLPALWPNLQLPIHLKPLPGPPITLPPTDSDTEGSASSPPSPDLRLADWLQLQGFDPKSPPAILSLIPRARLAFLATIAGHPRVSCQQTPLRVHPEPLPLPLDVLQAPHSKRCAITLQLPQSGSFQILPASPQIPVPFRLDPPQSAESPAWQLSPFPDISSAIPDHWPPALTQSLLSNQPVTVPAAEFLNALDSLQRVFLIDDSLLQSISALSPERPTPTAKFRLGGNLSRVDALVDLDYGEPFGSLPLTASPSPLSVRESIPARDESSRLWIPDALSEHSLRQSLHAAGFRYAEKRWQLSAKLAPPNPPDPTPVTNFLLDILPSWQNFAQSPPDQNSESRPVFPIPARILVGDGLSALAASLERVSPAVTLTPATAQGWFEASFEFSSASGLPGERWTPAQIQRLLSAGKRQFRTPGGKIAVLRDEDCLDLQSWIDSHSSSSCPSAPTNPSAIPVSRRDLVTLEQWSSRHSANGPNPPSRRSTPSGPASLPPRATQLLNAEITSLASLANPVIPRNYQREGVRWILHRLLAGQGALLADDMGLGKTLQTLLALRVLIRLFPEWGERPALAVMPASLLENWRQECLRFFPDLPVTILHGPNRENLPSRGLVLTTYALVARDLARHLRTPYTLAILDEASLIRNPDTDAARALRKLNAEFRLALTGTPVENRISDLWSVMQFALPGYLGPREVFRDSFERPLQQSPTPPDVLRKLRLNVSPWILRRMKDDVARELPPKMEFIRWCDLSQSQKSLYHQILDRGGDELAKLRESAPNSPTPASARMLMLTTLLRLRQLCDDPRLLGSAHDSPNSSRDSGIELAKTAQTLELLDELLANNHRVLVFSQFASMLRLLESELAARDVPCLRLDGSSSNRAETVASFQRPDGPPVFLISLKAGGYGLNLQAADAVIHLDPWWNPAVENQATDRAYRIGQTRPVQVYKLITRGTVEEKILSLQRQKASLLQALVSPEDSDLANAAAATSASSGLNDNELASLLDLPG